VATTLSGSLMATAPGAALGIAAAVLTGVLIYQGALRTTDTLRDQVVRLGSSTAGQCAHPVCLVEWRHKGTWHRYLNQCARLAQVACRGGGHVVLATMEN